MRHLGEALDSVRKSEYARLAGRDRRYIKGQKYTLLSRRENLTLDGKIALKTLLAANKRLNSAYLLKESFGQLWDYERACSAKCQRNPTPSSCGEYYKSRDAMWSNMQRQLWKRRRLKKFYNRAPRAADARAFM